jgi:hypothetical protein
MTVPKFVDIPGPYPVRIDANSVVCLRVEVGEHGHFLVIHTDKGFAVAVLPPTNTSIEEYYTEVLAALWPPKTSRATK